MDALSCRRRVIRGSTYRVIANRNEQVKEQQATGFHLHLHSAASLEDIPTPYDQSEVVCS